MTPVPSTDWPARMRLAARGFGIAPQAFWALSVKEWSALIAPPPAAEPLSQTTLAHLLSLYPDDPA